MYRDYGVSMLAICVISVIICAPLGAILTVSLGPKWLAKTEQHLEEKK